jgi:hypothetical protein
MTDGRLATTGRLTAPTHPNGCGGVAAFRPQAGPALTVASRRGGAR